MNNYHTKDYLVYLIGIWHIYKLQKMDMRDVIYQALKE